MSLADPLVQFAASLAAIAALVGLCRWLGFAHAPVLGGPDEAARIAGEALTGFRAAEVAVDPDGRGARLVGSDGGVVTVRPAGDRWVVRRL